MLSDDTARKLRSVPIDQWFSVINKSNEDMTPLLKDLIDNQEQFELSNDYKKFKRIDDSWLWA